MVAQIATGEIKDKVTDDSKNKAAVGLGRKRGKERGDKAGEKRLSATAKKAAAKRWAA